MGRVTKMEASVIILCSTVVSLILVHGSSSHLVPESVVSALIEEGMDGVQRYKRQMSWDEMNSPAQCLSDRLEAAFQGNTASFVSECKIMGAADLELDMVITDPPSLLKQFFRFYRVES